MLILDGEEIKQIVIYLSRRSSNVNNDQDSIM